MTREIKFRAWFKPKKVMLYMKDKNGKEIYEFMELNSKFEVIYQPPSFLLRDILNGDIVFFTEDETYVITRDFTKVS